MYRSLRTLAESGLLTPFSETIRNACVESLLLHIRVLSDILLPPSTPRDDDVTLRDLADSFVPARLEELQGAYKAEPLSVKATIDKRLAHATKRRSPMHDHSRMLNAYCPILEHVIAELYECRRRRGIV